MEVNLEAIKEIGYKHIILSTDSGYYQNDPWEIMLNKYLDYLVDHGVPINEIKYMSRINQESLLDLN